VIFAKPRLMYTAMEDLDLDPTPNQACVANVDCPVCHTGVLSFFLTFNFNLEATALSFTTDVRTTTVGNVYSNKALQ
jgi:hypothetical protein